MYYRATGAAAVVTAHVQKFEFKPIAGLYCGGAGSARERVWMRGVRAVCESARERVEMRASDVLVRARYRQRNEFLVVTIINF